MSECTVCDGPTRLRGGNVCWLCYQKIVDTHTSTLVLLRDMETEIESLKKELEWERGHKKEETFYSPP